MKKANSFIFWLLRGFLGLVLKVKYKFKFDRKSSKGIKRPCLILFNHQTSFDQFAVSMGFKFGINFVANDSIFRHGIGSFLMKAIARPIPISKGTTDPVAVRNIISAIKKGGAVALSPSGNRSFFGGECVIDPVIGKLSKSLKVPVVLVNLLGGFLTKPRWSNKPNKGKMTGKVVRVIKPNELAELSADDIFGIINKELSFNDYDFNKKAQIKFKGKHKAEYLESVLFYCPECGEINGLKSDGNYFSCSHCKMRVAVNNTGFFERIENAKKIPKTLVEWGQKQLEFIKEFDFTQFKDKPVFSDSKIIFSSVIRAKKQKFISKGEIALYADKFLICGKVIPLKDVKEMSIGVSKLSIYTEKDIYAIDADKNVNLFKYMVCGYHVRNYLLDIKEEYYGY